MPPAADAALDMLGKVELFEGLSTTDLRRIRQAGKELHFRPGQNLATEDRRGGRFSLILEGEAKVIVGRRTRATLGPGDAVGEISLIDGKPQSATVEAVTPVRVFSLASWNFRPLVRRHPSIAEQVMILLCQRLRRAQGSATL